MERQKRCAAIHDISCFGRCSLTVALPMLSAAGIETSVIPTAVLSTHTGGFTGYTYRDLTCDIRPIANHWLELGLGFDALYSGFLGSFEQLDIVSGLFDDLAEKDTLILVDPVMGDNGSLYSVFGESFPAGMAKLCKKAHVIVPNITEALFMLGRGYREGPYTKDYIEDLLFSLGALCNRVVLTGVYFDNEELGAASYDGSCFEYALSRRIEGFYHGTGDVFGSALLAALMNGRSLAQSSRVAVDFTVECISRSKAAGTDRRFGVNFEESLPSLLKMLDKI